MSAEHWQVVFVAVAAVAFGLFVVLYLFLAPWWKSGAGRSRIISDLSLSTLLWISLLAYWLHFVIPDWANLAILASIAAGGIYQLGVFVNLQIRRRKQ